jgi:hypothetical protein
VAQDLSVIWGKTPAWLRAAIVLVLLAIASAIAGHFVYRRFIAAVFIGAMVGIGELVSRYRDAPERALWTVSAMLYVVINAAASCLALYLIWRFQVAATGDPLRVIITQTLMAGFGAMAFFRTSLFIVRVGEQDVAIGPVAFLQVMLSATDRAVDRSRAEARAENVTDTMAGVSFDRAYEALPAFCFLLMQNVSIIEQKTAGDAIKALKTSTIDNETKAKNLGLLLLNVVGAKVLKSAVDELAHEIRKTAAIAILNVTSPMNVNDVAEAQAACEDTTQKPLPGRRVDWKVDDPAVVEVTADGHLTAKKSGQTTLRATSDDAAAAFVIKVN